MNTFGVWYDPRTWFDDEPADVASATGYTGYANDPFGYNFETWLGGGASTGNLVGGVSDADVQAYRDYLASGGVMVQAPPSSAASSGDIFGGFTDFLSGLTRNLPTLVGLGLNTWQNVESILASQQQAEGVRDRLIFLPGTNTPVIERTQGGNKTYERIADLYPSLAPQIQQAQSQNQLIGLALIGALGVGLFLILRPKKA